MMTKKEFKEAIEQANTIAISGHVRPDGDCTGSTLALAQYIRDNYKEKKVQVYLEPIRDSFLFLSGSGKVCHETSDEKYDLFVCCDCGDVERLGVFGNLYKNAKQTMCIDHHISNDGFGQISHINPKGSSTCELLFGLMEGEKVSKETAEALYLGIVHDTGVFKHSNTTKETMIKAGELLEKGVDSSYIIDETFYAKTYLQNQLLGRALMESTRLLDGKVIYSAISKDVMQFYGCNPSDLDGIIDQLRVTKGVEVAIFLYETEFQQYKVSMRSNHNVNVSSIAKLYGGGGHVKASGCTMAGTVHDVVNNLMEHIMSQLEAEEEQ